MTQEQFEHLEKAFKSMTDLEQWQWLINFPEKSNLLIKLDNDSTYVGFKDYLEDDLNFNDYLGNSYGVCLLLEALNIPYQNV